MQHLPTFFGRRDFFPHDTITMFGCNCAKWKMAMITSAPMWMILKLWQRSLSGGVTKSLLHFLLKSIGPPSYYLGNDYNWSEDEKVWVLGWATYIKECIHRLKDDPSFGTLHPH
jgi:hypothetical protein